jgi:hypothetical protein
MALTASQVVNITDSLAKGCDDFNTMFIANTASNSPTYSNLIAGISGTGATQTTGRILNLLDINSEVLMLPCIQGVATSVAAYIASIRSLAGYYQLLYPILNALDLSLPGGLNTFLTVNNIQVNAYIANAWNNFCSIAVASSYRTTTPIPIATANYFPYTSVDDLWDITCSGAMTFSTNQAGTNISTAVAGGGAGQFCIYKVNTGNAAGGATFFITYINSAGITSQASYTTSSGTPAASGSLANGYTISGAIGISIVSITGYSMTAGERYRLGIRLTRSPSY